MRASALATAALSIALVAVLFLSSLPVANSSVATPVSPSAHDSASTAVTGGAETEAEPAAPRPATAPTNALWSRLCTANSPYTCPGAPVSRKNAALAYDAADGYIVGFGGQTTVNAGVKNDSFYWNNGAWHLNSAGPSTLTIATNSSIAYDSTDGYVLLFGGWSGTGVTYRSFVFKYAAGTWTQLSPATKPAGRAGACMVNIPGHYVLLFGGQAAHEWFSDTWEYAGGVWTNVTSTAGTPPAGRAYAGCTYDSADGYAMLFGGAGGTGGATLYNDTWEWNVGTGQWTQLIATGSTSSGAGPVAQYSDSMAYVASLSEVLQTCGAVGTFAAPANQNGGCATYAWSGSTGKWTNISATVGFANVGNPSPKSGYSSTLVDAGGTYAMRFGGETSSTASTNATYAIGNLPVGNVTESLGEMIYNTTSTFYVNVTGGKTPYSYAWTNLPSGCTTANAKTLSCNPIAAGVYSAWNVSVVTADGFVTNFTGFPLTVDPLATVTGTVAPPAFAHTVNASLFWSTREYLATTMTSSVFTGYLNQTPYLSFIRWGASCDSANYTAGLQYSSSGASSPLSVSYGTLDQFLNETGDKWIFCVDGQENNAGMAASEVNYIENVVGMHPYYWSIGNEPSNWNHWNEPFASWSPNDNRAPTAHQFAVEVQNYTKAMKAVDPSIRIIGIQAGAGALKDEPWMLDIAQLDGPNLSAMAFHNYADGRGTNLVPVNQFLGQTNLSLTLKAALYDQQNLTTGCPTCHLPLFMDEFNAYTQNGPNPWQAGYPMVPYAGVGLVQSLEGGLSQYAFFDFFDGWNLSLVNSTPSQGLPRPAFALFTSVLGHLPLGRTYYDNVSTALPMWNAVSVASCNQLQCGLLVVNANTSVSLSLNPRGIGSSLGTCAEIYSLVETPGAVLSNGAATSANCPSTGLPMSLTIPPMGVKLIVLNLGNATVPATPVLASATGSSVSLITLEIAAAFGVGVLLVMVVVGFATRPTRSHGRRIGR